MLWVVGDSVGVAGGVVGVVGVFGAGVGVVGRAGG